MGSQFVDFNADGRIDFFTATFDGSPHVAYGVEGGFAEPERLLDKNGKRVLLDQYWDYDAKQWTGTETGEGHCTSAVAFDWDADGDYDVLMGTYGDGNLYLQLNEGKPGEPRFSGVSEPVLAGGKPFALQGGITAPRLIDWDGDGLMDLVCGSYGESYQGDPPGGVYLFRNTGKVGAPAFAAAQTLIAPTLTTGHRADRPNVGLYADPVDYDGDGDLDLVVGGYSIWKPEMPELTEAQRERVEEIEQQIEAVNADMMKLINAEMEAVEGLSKEKQQERLSAFYSSADYTKMAKETSALTQELHELKPPQQRKAAVWVYLRESS